MITNDCIPSTVVVVVDANFEVVLVIIGLVDLMLVAVEDLDGVFVVVERVFLNIVGGLVVVGDVAVDDKVVFVEVDMFIMVSIQKINIKEGKVLHAIIIIR